MVAAQAITRNRGGNYVGSMIAAVLMQELTHLGIGGASFFAPFVGTCELLCGALLIAGFLTRLATVPMIITMIVAIVTAKSDKIHSVTGLLGLSEFLLIVVLFAIAILGPGRVSIDEVVEKRLVDARHHAPLFGRRAHLHR